MIDEDALKAAVAAHKAEIKATGEGKFSRRRVIDIADMFGMKPMQMVWQMEKRGLMKRGLEAKCTVRARCEASLVAVVGTLTAGDAAAPVSSLLSSATRSRTSSCRSESSRSRPMSKPSTPPSPSDNGGI